MPTLRVLPCIPAVIASITLSVLMACPASASTITVTNTNDSGPGSLRNAITSASSGDTINFHLPAYPATITLSSVLPINTSLTISGPGANSLAISGNHAVQVFWIAQGINVNISGITVEYGSAECGGGIENFGTLTVNKSTLLGNSALEAGGAIFNGRSEVVYCPPPTPPVLLMAILTVSNSSLTGNSGDAIFNGEGNTVIVSNSNLSANSGTGIENGNGTIVVSGSNISGNNGWGIDNGPTESVLIMSNTTVSGNEYGIAQTEAYAFISDSTISGNGGAGIDNLFSTLSITNSSVFGNSGWGIYADRSSTLGINNSTLAGNAGGLTIWGTAFEPPWAILKNNILANNGSPGNCSGSFTSSGYNLSDDASCSGSLTATGDFNSTPSGLDPAGLKNNGGPTQTIALLATSPAVNAIPVNNCTAIPATGIGFAFGPPTPVTTDQRGIPRPQGGACNIGAYEYAVTTSAPTSGTACNGVYDGTFRGNIALSAGQQCVFLNGGVTGNVQQNGGSLTLLESQVGGNVQVNGFGTFAIGPGSTINGNLEVQNLPSASAQNQICGSTVQGNLQFQNNGTAVLFGAVPPNFTYGVGVGPVCIGNAIGGNLQVQNNWASTSIVGNTVRGDLTDQNNVGPTQVFSNTVSGNLQCQNDTAIQGGGNTVAGNKQGQCTGF